MTRHKLVPLFPSSMFEVCVGWDPALRSYYLDTCPARAAGRGAQRQAPNRAKAAEAHVPIRLLGRYYGEIDDVDELITVVRAHAQIPEDLDIVLRADPARVRRSSPARSMLAAS